MGARAGRLFAIASLIASGLVAGTAGTALAVTPPCGTAITLDTVFDSDITCTGFNPAFTLDSATLDLNGHTITGDGTNLCVEVIGTAAILENGTITNCDDGVEVVETSSEHIIRNIRSTNHSDDGFEVQSDGSIVRDNTASGNGDDGFDIVDGEGNLFFRNTVKNVGDNGYEIGNSPLNRLWSNTSSGADSVGFFLETGATSTVLARNTAKGSGSEGFGIQENSNRVMLNSASGNGAQGILIDASDNVVGGNKATNNGVGIEVGAGSTGNRVYGNSAVDNQQNDLVEPDDCSSNDWEGNSGKKVDNSCARGLKLLGTGVTPGCGETLEDGAFFLRKSIGPCSGSYALRLDNAYLDLRGNSIKGDGSLSACVLADGAPSLVEKGSLSGCDDGVLVPDTSGGHIIRKMKTTNIADDAFDIEGDDNVLHRNTAVGAEGHSFRYGGAGNYLFKNKAKKDVGAAFDNHGADNVTWSSKSTNSLRGFVVDDDATRAELYGNKARLATDQGFDIRGDLSIVLVNASSENNDIGFEVSSDPGAGLNLVGGNTATENDVGISLQNALPNSAIGNTAKRNDLDLEDLVDACITNLWEGNRFKTDDPDCIT